MNNWNGIGRLTKKPELRTSGNGNNYCFFTVAINQRNKDGKEMVDFVPCVAYGKVSENMSQYLDKGSLVGIQGRVSVSLIEDNGQKRTAVNIAANRVEFLNKVNSNESFEDAVKKSDAIINGFDAPADSEVNDLGLWD